MCKDKAREIVMLALEDEDFELIYETHVGPDYVDVIGELGGEVRRRRYYDDGSVYAKSTSSEKKGRSTPSFFSVY